MRWYPTVTAGPGDRSPTPGAAAGSGGAGSRSGTTAATGRAHRNLAAEISFAVGRAVVRGLRGPSLRTVSAPDSKPTTTVPSRSVRRTRAPAAASRSSVTRVGWPYGLPVPADATATRGWTTSTNACVVAVRLPWCATLRRSTRGSPAAISSGSTPSSTSPIKRNLRVPISPSRTTDTLLIAVPPSGGSTGTRPRNGQRTRIETSSTRRRSPAAIPVRCGPRPLDRSRNHAAYPGPRPIIPGSSTRSMS